LKLLADALLYYRLELRRGATYLIGKQIFPGTTYWRDPETAIGCSGFSSVIIRGNGATLKTNGGMYYGSFNPATGLATNDAVSTLSHQARIPVSVNLSNNSHVHVENLFIDGNSGAQTLGGQTQTPYTEAGQHGLSLAGNLRATVINVHVTNILEDGILNNQTAMAEGDTPRPHTFINCSSRFAGRCSLSIEGGIGYSFYNCKFSDAGNAPVAGGGFLSTGPATNLDIESETGVIRDVAFYDCEFLQGPHGQTCYTQGSGDSKNTLFFNCILAGTLWPDRPQIKFRDCKIYGYFSAVYDAIAAGGPLEDALTFDGCFISDAAYLSTPAQMTTPGVSIFNAGANGMNFRNCKFDVNYTKLSFGSANISDVTCTIRTNTTYISSASNIVSLGSGNVNNLQIIDAIATNPPTSYLVGWTVGGATIRNSEIVSATPRIRWKATTGYAGKFDNTLEAQPGIDFFTGSTALDVSLSREVQALDTTIVANKTVTLPAPVAGLTRRYRIMRTPNGTGAFNVVVQTSAAVQLFALANPSTFVDVISYSGAEYIVLGFGNLDSLQRGALGYQAGVGGTAVQPTSKTTAVTNNKVTGQFTTNAASLAAGAAVTFVVNDTSVLATDNIILNLASGAATAGTYNYQIDAVSANSFRVWLKNISAGALAEALTFTYSIIRAQNS
jgi:hypothetical protein